MSDTKKKTSPFDYLDPFTLTNLMIRILWRVGAGVIALAFRIPTSIILYLVARVRRARVTRW